jgi:hypothetical protein
LFYFSKDKNDANKPGIVVSARVHPGESNSSWIMKGLIEFLSGSTEIAKVSAVYTSKSLARFVISNLGLKLSSSVMFGQFLTPCECKI